MKFSRLLFLIIFISVHINSLAQTPSPAILASDVTVTPGQAVDVVFTSDNDEFWNIVTFNGTITWDPLVCTYSGLVSSQLFQMNSANFDASQAANGILTWNWMHMITIGQSIPRGQEIFTLKFTASNTGGLSTNIDFSSTPNPMYWNNFAGWSGTTHTSPGTFTIIGCPQPIANFSFTNNGLDFSFSNTSQTSGNTGFVWDFGDGSTSTTLNPTHTYNNDSTYMVCLYLTDSCGSDTICQNVQPCFFPTANFVYTNNGSIWDFTDSSSSGPNTLWEWTFSNGGGSLSQNPSHSFAADSSYIVCLTITDDCGQDTFCDTISTYSTANLNSIYNFPVIIYPNPFINQLNINLNQEFKKINLQIYNTLGQTVFYEMYQNQDKISISPIIKNGLYTLEVEADSEFYYFNLLKR